MSTAARIVELDFGMGNIRSLQKAFEHLGKEVTVSADPKVAAAADVLLLPGDGAFARAMEEIRARGLYDVIHEARAKQKTIFGICIGFQLFFESSTEFTGAQGLGFVPGAITRLEKNTEAPAIPHIGWTTTEFTTTSRLGRGINPHSMFYYVHSYACRETHTYATATTYYGQTFTSVLEHENLYAVQFHPEKSHTAGLKLIQNFLELL
ncbi:MAG: imidazole glycerol phosphate synthase subunit HisH [Turneriella sp.]|nr:imidazole glycerol phosphate synthase subunit HisH [Turneriella sp.]